MTRVDPISGGLRSAAGSITQRRCSCGSTFARPGTRSPIPPASSPATATGSPCSTTACVRLEYSESGEFEDRACQTVVDRAFAPAEFDVTETDDRLKIHTERLQLVYDKRPFSTHGLSVQAKGG